VPLPFLKHQLRPPRPNPLPDNSPPRRSTLYSFEPDVVLESEVVGRLEEWWSSGQQMESFYKAAQAVSTPLGGGGWSTRDKRYGRHAPLSNAARCRSQDTDTQSRGSPSSRPRIYSNMLSANTHSEAAASVTTAASLLPRCALPSSRTVVFDVSDSMRSDQGMIERF
jgi:hypothetical protein